MGASSKLEEVFRAYWPLFESSARQFAGRGGAEFDDLVQEGGLAAWETMSEKQYTGIKIVVMNAMRDWVRYCRRRGITYDDPPLS